tara:strand:+ start:693 stop:1208 length:516 start_codon:yes stop_codon:yes gene_type:complete
MKNIKGDLWEHVGRTDLICITTNAFVKSNGQAVMGKGCAKEATIRYPGIAAKLGRKTLKKSPPVAGLVKDRGTYICSFMVKPGSAIFNGSNAVKHMIPKFKVGDLVPGWACLADIELIKASAKHLMEIMDGHEFKSAVIPRPGCGAGELKWSEVEPILQTILDDRVSVITF